MWFPGGGLSNGQWEEQHEAEKGAIHMCDLSRNLALVWSHGELWSTELTTEPVPIQRKGMNLLSPMAISSWLCVKRQGADRQAIFGLGQFSKKRTILAWLLVVSMIVTILFFIFRYAFIFSTTQFVLLKGSENFSFNGSDTYHFSVICQIIYLSYFFNLYFKKIHIANKSVLTWIVEHIKISL